MIFLEETEYIKNNTLKKSNLTKEDFKFFDEKMFNDKGKTFIHYINDPSCHTMFFDTGVIIFKIYDIDYEGYNQDRVCLILSLCKKKDGKVNWEEWKEEFKNFLRLNNCTKIKMYTELNPEFWIKNYNFKLKYYEMELDL